MDTNLFLLDKRIGEKTDVILEKLKNFIEYREVKNALKSKSGADVIGRGQLNSLLRNSREANSVEEIKLLIAYKEAKDKGKGWNYDCGGITLAQKLLETIREVEKVASTVYEELTKENIDIDLRIVKLKVVEKFLGYLYWQGTVIANEEGGK